MRRTIRCDHGFMEGLCREPGCKHEEKRPQTRLAETIHNPEEKPQRWRQRPRAREAKRARKLFLLTALVIGCGGRALPYPGDFVSECGAIVEVARFTTPADTCRLLTVPPEFDRELAINGECPDGERCAVVLPGETWISWATPGTDEGAVLVGDPEELRDEGCPLACE